MHGPGPASAEHTRKIRILIVEDQVGLQRVLRINLRARLYDVMAACTGREALAMAASQPPDAVVLDLGLPDIDGTCLLGRVARRARRGTR